jgi:hypothetical protein
MAGCVGAAAAWPALVQIAHAAAPGADFCVTVCNHWSYIGIGWQLGIESCVLSVTDAMEMADREPHVKTCINLDARAYELMAEKFPEVVAKLAKALAAGKVELIGGTYGQPMGTTIGGESNIRQIVVGWETVLLPMDAWNKSLTWGWGATRFACWTASWKGCSWPPRSSTPRPQRWGPSPRSSCSTRHGKTSWPRRAMT